MSAEPSARQFLPATEVRAAFDQIGITTDTCEVLIDSALGQLQALISQMRETGERNWSSPQTWRAPSALLQLALEKVQDAKETADRMATVEIAPEEPRILRGAVAIGKHLGVSNGKADHLDKAGQLPTFRVPGDNALHATATGLDDWRQLASSAALLD